MTGSAFKPIVSRRSACSQWRLWLGLAVGALVVIGSALPSAARARCQVESLDLPVRMVGTRAVATVGINGTSVPLMVDSGAAVSLLTDAAAAQLRLPLRHADGIIVEGITGTADVRMTRVDKLQVLNGEIPKVQFIVGGNEPGAGTMGLLGRTLLSATDTEYDLAHGVIRLLLPNDECSKVNMAYWAGSSPVTEIDLIPDRSTRTPELRAHAKLNGSDVVVMFDSGATSIVTVRAAARAGVFESAMTPAGVMYGVGRGNAKSWTARFERFELGGEAVVNSTLRVGDFSLNDEDMLLGIDFFLSHRIYVSKSQSKMFFTYSGGAVFALDKSEAAAAAPVDADTAASGTMAVTADQLASRAAAFAARADYTSALADLNRACELEPASAALLAQRGAVHLALRQTALALADFDKALALNPAQADARGQRALMRFTAKDADGAKADLFMLDRQFAPQAQGRLGMAQIYLDLDEPALALAQLNQWLPAHPHEIFRDRALNSRCRARLMLGVELDKALDDCDDAVDRESKSPLYRETRGWVQVRLGNYRKAVSDFDRSIELRPGSAGPLYGRGLAEARLGDAAHGDADLVAARTLDPEIEAKLARAGLLAAPGPKP